MKTEDEIVLEVHGLRKSYGTREAICGIDFSVYRGEIFGLIGHNGAGKSTTIECILGTRTKDAGTITALGMDPVKDRKRLFEKVGVQFQQSCFQDKLYVKEACEMTAALYENSQDWNTLLERFHLADKRKTYVNELSGGEKQKLAITLALIPNPALLFLDELTTGLDPQARRGIWQYLEGLKKDGITIVLTSHYMDEVETLCDRIAIMKEGYIAVQGTPESLIATGKGNGAKNLEDIFLAYMEKEEL